MRYKKGFSLLELLIVCAIIGIMTAVALVYISKSSRAGKEVEMAAREVAASIREAQNSALGGKQPDAAEIACGMGLATNNNKTSYKIFYNKKSDTPGNDCVGGGAPQNQNNAQSVQLALYELGNDVQFSNGYGNKSIYFTMPHGAVYGNNGNLLPANGNFPLEVEKSGYKYCVRVYPSGNVTESKAGC